MRKRITQITGAEKVEEKKSETVLTASVLKKRSKTHKRLKERFLVRRKRTKRANFRGGPPFQARYNNETEKQTINSIYLCVSWIWKAGGRESLSLAI